ncbi:hypothetical protein HPP92_010605 [Vanilla planifolia]|uniref:Uncharacterized protein n=1 Tax=Vanilla planifolia TaxID=51239 RepID=A0A835R428_VANPL|nr:hypothetical protein HPP92_010605 [Vanilla planifolia]
MSRPEHPGRSLPSANLQFPSTRVRTPPPRLLLVNKFTESRAPELESLHSIVSARLNHDFCGRRDKRRRTTGFRSGKNRRQKRQRLIDGGIAASSDGVLKAGDSDGKNGIQKEKKFSRRVRRRLELRRNPAVGFCLSGDGTKRLRTHLWHAKRFAMVKRWGYYLPLGLQGRGKGSRAVMKWLKSGAVMHDASYSQPILLEGPEESILCIVRMVSFPFPSDVSGQLSTSVMYGSCYSNSMLYNLSPSFPKLIAPVFYMWRPMESVETNMNSEQPDGCSSPRKPDCSTSLRQLWIWVHPASYNEGLGVLKRACQKQMNETGVNVSCASFEGRIGRLELYGAMSLKILQKILKPVPWLQRIDNQSLFGCSSLRPCSTSQLQSNWVLDHAEHLPARAIFSLTVLDPRNLPVKETKLFPTAASSATGALQYAVQDSSTVVPEESNKDRDFLQYFWANPETSGPSLSDSALLWDSTSELKPPLPEHVICKEKHSNLLKQLYLNNACIEELADGARDCYDTSCPVLLLKHAYNGTLLSSGWSIILPLTWVKPFWMSLVLNGGRSIGLREKRWIACSSGLPSFPNDFPDSRAYSSLMACEAAIAEEAAKRRPPLVRPMSVPLAPPWDSVAYSLHHGVKDHESGYTNGNFAEDNSLNMESQDYTQPPTVESAELFDGSILRTSNDFNGRLEENGCKGYLNFGRGLCFVRVLIHAYKEGSFEEGAVVCSLALSDLPAWKPSTTEEHEPLQMPHCLVKSYFTRQDSGKWVLQVPQECSTLQWYRLPIGFITTGFVRGSKPVAVAFCELRLLMHLKEQQARHTDSAQPSVFVLVRNLRSTTYRRALATIVLEQQEEDLEFM